MNTNLYNFIYPNGIYNHNRSNSLTIKKHFPEIYDQIKNNYHINLYILLHNIDNIPICQNLNCNNKVKLKSIGAGFRKFCSNKCIAQFQKSDKNFSSEIKKTKNLNYKKTLKERYPNLNISIEGNFYIIKDYCKHGSAKLYSTTFKKLYNENKCLCVKCNDETFNNYKPSEKEIKNFQLIFNKFYNDHSLAIKNDWFILHYPKEYKIILEWSKHLKNISIQERIYLFKHNLKNIPKCKNCGINYVTFNKSNLKYNHFCKSYSCVKNISSKEIELLEFLKSIDQSTKSKFFIDRNEYDIIIKNKNLLIEFNGLYWHSELVKEDKNYHYNKYILAKNNGYELINVWEDDWNFKQDIIKSMLINKISDNKIQINAINCTIKEIKDTKQFLNLNHIEGWDKSDINLGLYINNDVVCLMTFKKYNEEYELLKYCNKLYTNVVGGEEKLFNYFLEKYKPNKIVAATFLDYAITNLYKILYFKEVKHLGINYWWSDGKQRYNNVENEDNYYKIYGLGKIYYERIK